MRLEPAVILSVIARLEQTIATLEDEIEARDLRIAALEEGAPDGVASDD